MSRLPRISVALLMVILIGPAPVIGQQFARGTVQTLPVITISLNVGSMEKEVRHVVYSPPPGWHIRSHRVECTSKSGLASYTVNTIPADWAWSSDESATESTNAKAGATAQAHGLGGKAQGTTESRKMTSEHQRMTANHHALVVDAMAHGSGFFGKGAALELTVYAELVYVGPVKPLAPPRPPLLKPVPATARVVK